MTDINDVVDALREIAAQLRHQTELLEAKQLRDAEIIRDLGMDLHRDRGTSPSKPMILRGQDDA